MKFFIRIFFGFLCLLLAPALTRAATPLNVTLKTDWRLWNFNLASQDIFSDYTKTTFRGIPVSIPEAQMDPVRDFIEVTTQRGVDVLKLRGYLEYKLADAIYREREDITIDTDIDGNPVFSGTGLYGRKLDSLAAAFAVKAAIENDVPYVHLPILRDEPKVTVEKKLAKKGITELVASGETVFKGSPANRINNIQVGIGRFNGHIVRPGETFVFGEILGPVEEWTGYKKELVIAGDRTVPEYGGGLCQVSTTAYRAALFAGFPIAQRRNHSYAVSYYEPIGLDATVYPPQVDMKFINDSDSHLLIQSFTRGDTAYYNFYGTKDHRRVAMLGPYYSDREPPPLPRTEYTTQLKPGETEVLGHAVSGVNAAWYREVEYADAEPKRYLEGIYSKYQARPDFKAVGVTREELESHGGGFSIRTTY